MATDVPLVDAAQLLGELRRTFSSGRTKSEKWRSQQLRALLKMVTEQEKEICKALTLDLGKSEYETYACELAMLLDSCKLAIKCLKKWMSPEKRSIAVATIPSTAVVHPEPLGIALVVSAWNFPILLALDPLVGAVAAGCAVVIKPSEIAPATSAFLAKFIPMYMDKEAIRVVEGGVQQITALLDQKWDKIFFTGNAKVGRIMMAAAAKHLTPVTLELGGKCPVYIDSTVDVKVWQAVLYYAKLV
jgi:aldehyde dehydrogenase (NAD+)